MTADAAHVTPGGASLIIHDSPAAQVRKASVGDMDNNVYLVTCLATGAQLLVDAADDVERLRSLIDEGTGNVDGILTTHRHDDHTRALAALVQAYPEATTYAGRHDADALPVPAQVRLAQGDEVAVGEVKLGVIELRGHTPGSIALVLDDAGAPLCLTGDSLFPGGPGKTWSEEDFASLMDDVEGRLFGALDDTTRVHPGHGDSTTIGAERPSLASWRERGW